MSTLIESVPMPDVYCSGMHKIEDLGDGNLRVLMYVEKDGERHLAVPIVMPLKAMPECIMLAVAALAIAGANVAKLFPMFERLMMQ